VTPKTMFWAYMLNIPLAFAMLLVFLFAMTDVSTAVDQAFPFVWILSNSLSTAGAQAITAIMFILVFMIATSCFASTSRQLFAFARDDGMPFPTWMKKVNPQLNVAANSCLVTWGYTVVMSLIYIGSPIAFNAIISLAIVALMATYAISIACVLWRRITHPETLPPVFWSLGKWGVVVNVLGLVYAIYAFFWAFWPIYWKPTADEVSVTVFLVLFPSHLFFCPFTYREQKHTVTVVFTSPCSTLVCSMGVVPQYGVSMSQCNIFDYLSVRVRKLTQMFVFANTQMNWAIVIFAGVMFISAVNYVLSAHRMYKGPVATCEGWQDR
jgi:amino acid transporter